MLFVYVFISVHLNRIFNLKVSIKKFRLMVLSLYIFVEITLIPSTK